MKKFFFLLLIALAALAYYQFSYVPSVAETQVKSPSALLAPYVSSSGEIFAALENKTAPPARQEIQSLEIQFRGALQGASASDRPVYENAISLCRALIASLDAREKYAANLDALRSNPNSLALAIDKEKERMSRQQFFSNALETRWANAGKPMQESILIWNAALKKAEGRSSFAPPDLPSRFAASVASLFGK